MSDLVSERYCSEFNDLKFDALYSTLNLMFLSRLKNSENLVIYIYIFFLLRERYHPQ